jgi:predicted MPP superfamily phosphohydrolase
VTLENGRGRAPRPDTWFTRRTVAWRRAIARTVALCNRALDRVPLLRIAYRLQLERGLSWTSVPWPLPPGSAALAGTRAAFLSDIHLGSYVTPADLAKVCEQINERGPDLVLIGGDTVHTRAREIDELVEPLGRLRAPLGVYAVPGNHERYPGIDLAHWTSRLESIGIEVLRDRGLRLERGGAGFWLAGVDDLTEGAPDIERAFAGRSPDEPALVLSHHPDLFPELVPRAPVMVLSGHTHGGQIAPFGRILMRHSLLGFDRGLHVHGLARLYVGRGIGASIVPLRVGAPPEVPFIEMLDANGC